MVPRCRLVRRCRLVGRLLRHCRLLRLCRWVRHSLKRLGVMRVRVRRLVRHQLARLCPVSRFRLVLRPRAEAACSQSVSEV